MLLPQSYALHPQMRKTWIVGEMHDLGPGYRNSAQPYIPVTADVLAAQQVLPFTGWCMENDPG